MQAMLELAPAVVEYLPASQETHVAEDVAVTVPEYFPAGHCVHTCASSNEYAPAGHASTPTVTTPVCSVRVNAL